MHAKQFLEGSLSEKHGHMLSSMPALAASDGLHSSYLDAYTVDVLTL